MELTLNELIGRHEEKPGIVIGLGPSLKDYQNQIDELKTAKPDDLILLTCNEWDKKTILSCTDYWCFANNEVTVKSMASRINARPPLGVLYSVSIDSTSPAKLEVPYLPYHSRDPKNIPWAPDDGVRIQTELKRLSNFEKEYGSGATVVLHMLALAILMGCNPIYIVGVDLSDTYVYVDGSKRLNASWSAYVDNILLDLKIITESAKKMGIDIFNLNSQPKFDFIPNVENIAAF
jgi:hypothetical protein